MRGTFGVDFDLETVRKVGTALPGVVSPLVASAEGGSARRPRWLVGRDCRQSSPDIRDALVRGLAAAGAEVVDIGLCTTPMVYFFTGEDAYDGSVMVTASHNPPSDNGLKVSRRTALPVSYASGLSEVERIVGRGDAQGASEANAGGKVAQLEDGVSEDFVARYLEWHRTHNRRLGLANSTLSFAVDCSNGTGSILARRLFPGAVLLNDTPDGAFPAHSPNPLKADAREQLAKTVRVLGLDCGVMFDGDADRAVFVDEKGEFVQPDHLIPIVACSTFKETDGAADGRRIVIHDVRTSRGAIEAIREMGCEPLMVPVGPALAKPTMRETGAQVGGEFAGHYYFSEFHSCDSGVLAAIRVLSEVAEAKAEGVPFSEMVRPIASRYANSGELNYMVADKDAAIAEVLSVSKGFGAVTGRSDIDGTRLEFGDGWVNVRKSNTEPYLRLIAEHRTRSGLESWIHALEDAIGRVDGGEGRCS